MQNMDIQQALTTRKLSCTYSAHTLQGFLDLGDLAAVSALVLLDPAPHNRARYELVGENARLEDVAKMVGEDVTCEQVLREEFMERVRSAKVGDPGVENFVEGLDRMLYYYDKR